MRASVTDAAAGARLLAAAQCSEVEVYYSLSRLHPHAASAMCAAAIVQLAMSPQSRRTDQWRVRRRSPDLGCSPLRWRLRSPLACGTNDPVVSG
jgi:hypothetical protein